MSAEPQALRAGPHVQIPLAEFEFTYVRSGGPGGQNVNKVNSKAQLRWALATSPSLSEETRTRLLSRLGNRLTSAGELLIVSQRFRDQARNAADCLERLQALLLAAATPPKLRKATRPSRASKQRRLEAKRRQSQRKAGRGRPAAE